MRRKRYLEKLEAFEEEMEFIEAKERIGVDKKVQRSEERRCS